MNQVVLSGTAPHVPSGTRFSCHRGPESRITRWRSVRCSRRNFPNLESFGFFLTDAAGSTAVGGQVSRTGAEFREPGAEFAYRVRKPRTEVFGKGFSIGAFSSLDLCFTHCNLPDRSVHELGTFRSEFTNPEPARLRQLVGKTRVGAQADSRNSEHRQRLGPANVSRSAGE